MACQFRFRTSTVAFVNMFINSNGYPSSVARCLFFVEMGKVAASPGFAPGPPVSETDALLITPRGKWKWSLGKVLPLRLLGVGQP
jgi:hypothetical protein